MLKASKDFQQFARCAYGFRAEIAANMHVLVNNMHQNMVNMNDRSVWQPMGRNAIAFLEDALRGPYSDDDLAEMWFRSGAEFGPEQDFIREFLEDMLKELKYWQAQKEAGTFIALQDNGQPFE